LSEKEKKWEHLFLEEFSNNVIPKDKRDAIPETVILGLGFKNGYEERLAKPLHRSKKIGQFHVGTYNDLPMATVCQSMGSLNTEVVVRVLTKTPVRSVVGVGLAGALQKDIGVGSIILPTLALRGEGTTDYYAPKDIEAVPSSTVQNALAEALGESAVFHKGSVFTTGALIKEDDEIICKLNKEGVLGIECETSVLFLVSRLYGIDSGAILLVSDNPLLKILWCDPGMTREFEKGFAQVVKAAYEAASTIAGRQRVADKVQNPSWIKRLKQL